MIYLDYSATTYPNKNVLNTFIDASISYKGNPNSSHSLGLKTKQKIDEVTNSILDILKIKNSDLIYTSGATEANNLAIKGICNANKGKHIITTMLEHSSVIAPINRLCKEGYEVSFAKLDENGLIDLDDLQTKIRKDTVLVSIVGVDSELGIRQNIEKIGKMLKEFPNCYFHVDATQLIGKTKFDFTNVDLISFSAHKFFGIKGIGALIKKQDIKLEPLLDGGLSTTKYRSGTPCTELIISLEKALKIAYSNFDKKLLKIKKKNKDLKDFFKKYNDVAINNTSKSIDQIINISLSTVKSSDLVEALNKKKIYLSTKSACSNVEALSKAVMQIYNDELRAENSIRISISYVTTTSELNKFKKIFHECYTKLGGK